MMPTVAQLKRGQRAVVKKFCDDSIPLKLLEMGCLPGNAIELLQIAPFKDPLYLNINGSYVAIRKDIAEKIEVELA
ncbi:ferrous iron transport protein A [Mesonia sp. HuA40]|nr:FeoA family protein [Mesonia sp. HuA40]TXK72770.1 ferrous iron transport protein A [Mesonia sp. HuA40]